MFELAQPADDLASRDRSAGEPWVDRPVGHERVATLTAVPIPDVVRRVAALVPGPQLPIDDLEFAGVGGFASAFDVTTAALAAGAVAALANGSTTIDRGRVVATFSGQVDRDGEPVSGWADLSGYYPTRDAGFIQFHCNFPHHADGVVARLDCEPTRESIAEAVLGWDPQQLETVLIDDGMIAARLRTLDEWAAHPHAVATGDLPLISVERIGDGDPRSPERRSRVLDCSRVLAGPVAGQVLAAHEADVLRVGSAHLPSVEIGVLGTGSGKRNAFVDLRNEPGRADFRRLLADADVWIDAYRPGAFAGHGFTLETMTPGTVAVQLCAFDWVGPWADRRGFDSIVQSTTGIVRAGQDAAATDGPTPLPVQALDYCTGLLAAFAAAQLVAHQAEVGGTWLARLSLLRTRNWLVGLGGPDPFVPEPLALNEASRQTFDTPFGAITTARPISGEWRHGPQPLGSSPPTWET